MYLLDYILVIKFTKKYTLKIYPLQGKEISLAVSGIHLAFFLGAKMLCSFP
ncbi:asr2036 [Nostoc sp. PCC 7120 = FACHB-418]|nr:asr2036 [Nostoc sp. PCC 7120 = FACHB-418]